MNLGSATSRREMVMSWMLHRLLLAGTCVCVFGNPVEQSLVRKQETGLLLNNEDPGRPEGMEVVTQAENGASADREYGSRVGGGGRDAPVGTPAGGQPDEPGTKGLTFTASPQTAGTDISHLTESLPEDKGRSVTPTDSSDQRTVTPNPAASSDLIDAAVMSTLSEPLEPDIGTNLMPREDDMESLWTEETRPSGVTEDTMGLMSQDEATEGTMSSEALPLIFEPVEDVTPEEATSLTSASRHAQLPAAMATGGWRLSEVDLKQLVTVEADSDSPSHATPLLMPDWTSPWQASGSELLDPIGQSEPTVLRRRLESGRLEDGSDRGNVRTAEVDESHPIMEASLSSMQDASTAVTMATQLQSRSGLEQMESEEDEDDEEEENSEESVEDDSEEDLTDAPRKSLTQPPYSIIPPPPVWVQRNQGLMRSWVDLIREKAGYVSGMLAPVGIGIAGALLIVGALYSVRMIHRKRRNSFKHQRRKVRQPEPGELSTSGQDQAMLLADSSEDEF
ncbi:uncharacterized protein armh4 isoform 2-T2 [Synchiropus picturatus]